MTSAKLLRAGILSAAAWVLCETLGGLFFLSLGVRLWRYQIAPLFLAVTSPVIWGLAFLLMGPLTLAWLDVEQILPLRRAGRLAARAAFFMSVGPVLEVLLNRGFFATTVGRPLYLYTFLPTFGGSGSLLSPFYYSTLLIHVPWIERARRQKPAEAAETTSSISDALPD